MISTEEAHRILSVESARRRNITGILAVTHTTGRILQKDIKAKLNSPAFNQAAMDGYCINLSDTEKKTQHFKLSEEIKAGDPAPKQIKDGECCLIFTGSRVPANAGALIPIENVRKENNLISFESLTPQKGLNIRYLGEQFKKGQTLIKKGTLLNGTHLAVAVAAGIQEIAVIGKPRVSLIITGNEIKKSGEETGSSGVYDTNSILITEQLKENGINNIELYYCKDNLRSLTTVIRKAQLSSDVVLLTGGVSVGKYDFTKEAATNNGFKVLFHKIKQKPGKPLLFARNKNTYLFGLPGNPAAAYTCLNIYALPFLLNLFKMQNHGQAGKETKLVGEYDKKAGLTHFLKGRTDGLSTEILKDQESYKILPFMQSNCLIEIPEDCEALKSGDTVRIYPI